MSQFLTLREAAQVAHCHPITLRRAIKQKKLEAGMVGFKGYRISEEKLQAWLVSQAQEVSPYAS